MIRFIASTVLAGKLVTEGLISLIRACFKGGVGVCAGVTIKRSRRHLEVVRPIIQYTAAAGQPHSPATGSTHSCILGFVGAVMGASVASLKNTSRLNHAVTLGVNFSVGSAVYTGELS